MYGEFEYDLLLQSLHTGTLEPRLDTGVPDSTVDGAIDTGVVVDTGTPDADAAVVVDDRHRRATQALWAYAVGLPEDPAVLSLPQSMGLRDA